MTSAPSMGSAKEPHSLELPPNREQLVTRVRARSGLPVREHPDTTEARRLLDDLPV